MQYEVVAGSTGWTGSQAVTRSAPEFRMPRLAKNGPCPPPLVTKKMDWLLDAWLLMHNLPVLCPALHSVLCSTNPSTTAAVASLMSCQQQTRPAAWHPWAVSCKLSC
jgi:hypothetical protein